MLADNFQLDQSGREKESTVEMRSDFLTVILKRCFFICVLYAKLFQLVEAFSKMSTKTFNVFFTKIKRGLSTLQTLGDD